MLWIIRNLECCIQNHFSLSWQKYKYQFTFKLDPRQRMTSAFSAAFPAPSQFNGHLREPLQNDWNCLYIFYPLYNSFAIQERQIQFQKLTFLQNGQWYQISFDHKHGNDALWCVDVLRFFLWRQISGQMVALVYIVCKFQ